MARQRFVLIDQSIAGLAGHHYEYAVHVLRAAQRAGYEPVLATNVAFKTGEEKLPWTIIPAYHKSFWDSEGAPKWSFLPSLLKAASWVKFKLRYIRRYSALGLVWSIRDNLTSFIGMQMLRRGNVWELAPLVLLALAIKICRFVAVIALFPVAVAVFLWRLLLQLLRVGHFPSLYVQNATADFRDLATFFRKLFLQRNVLSGQLQRKRHRRSFCEDTARLIEKSGARSGDIFFIPTISPTEMTGLADLLAAKPEVAKASWHLMFRRNLYIGRDLTGESKDQHSMQAREAFQNSADVLRQAGVHFYTDTEELTQQYDSMRIFPFRTAPIPHTHQPLEQRKKGGGLRVLYMGDARSEKGYHFIPDLIENVWDDYIVTGRVEFHLQSNFNIPHGEPRAAIARQRLEALALRAPHAIHLYKKPFNSDQYRDLILSGDINLLFYDPDNYYARSSGILVESLSAGIPVIAPASCWLTRQFREPMWRWQRELAQTMQMLSEHDVTQFQWRRQDQALGPAMEGSPFAITTAYIHCGLRVPDGAALLLAEFTIQQQHGRDIWIAVDPLDEAGKTISSGRSEKLVETGASGEAVVCVPIPSQAAKVRLSLRMAKPGPTEKLALGKVRFLAPAAGEPGPPVSAVGVDYDHIGQIEARFRELVDHHPHYASTARQFAERWRDWHNADRLIEVLEEEAVRRRG